MKARSYIRKYGSVFCIVASLLLFFLSLILNTTTKDTGQAARRVEKRIDRRMELLDTYIRQVLDSDYSDWLDLDLPEDMVVYRYVYDTLQSWCNQFPINNDDISSRLVIQRLTGLRSSLESPLRNVTDKVQYLNLGSKWYLVKSATDGISSRIIAGLEIKDHLAENIHKPYNGINRHLKLPGSFSIEPINEAGGYPVSYDGSPVFKIIPETGWDTSPLSNSAMRWVSLLLIVMASLFYLWTHRTVRIFAVNAAITAITACVAYFWGLHSPSAIFSPTIYAGGTFLYSFGALIILDMTVILLIVSLYLIRGKFIKWMRDGNRRQRAYVYGASVCALAVTIAVYTGLTLHSLVMNSSIQLELHMWSHITVYTAIVYIVYMVLLFCILLLIQMLSPALFILQGRRYSVFDRKYLLLFAAVSSIYFTGTLSILGFSKEQNRMIVLSNRLAVDRDLGLELNLRGVEDAIAADPFISALSHLERSNLMILNRLTEAGVQAEDKLFATLDTTTRSMKLPNGQNVLLSDTVGFISELPEVLVEAFSSTLEEALSADAVIIVADASHPDAPGCLKKTKETLSELGALGKVRLLVISKTDDISDDISYAALKREPYRIVETSMKEGKGIGELLKAMADITDESFMDIRVTEPASSDIVSRLSRDGDVKAIEYGENSVTVTARIRKELAPKYRKGNG